MNRAVPVFNVGIFEVRCFFSKFYCLTWWLAYQKISRSIAFSPWCSFLLKFCPDWIFQGLCGNSCLCEKESDGCLLPYSEWHLGDVFFEDVPVSIFIKGNEIYEIYHLICGVQTVFFRETSPKKTTTRWAEKLYLEVEAALQWGGPTYAVDWLHLTTIPIFCTVFWIQLPHMISSLLIVANWVPQNSSMWPP